MQSVVRELTADLPNSPLSVMLGALKGFQKYIFSTVIAFEHLNIVNCPLFKQNYVRSLFFSASFSQLSFQIPKHPTPFYR